jgi:hypothetical protein
MQPSSESLLLVPIVVIVGALLLMILALVWQNKGLAGQQRALSHIEGSMAISRRAVEFQERSIALVEELISNQRTMIDLLRRDGDRRWMGSSESA